MKLLSKITFYITLSKTAIVVLFILLLPVLVNDLAFRYTNYSLNEQKKKVINTINKNGIDYYFQGDSSYGSYTMLKEEYISLDAAPASFVHDTIETTQRIVEADTLTYRVLTYQLHYKGKKYQLEIGKTLEAINQFNKPLQRVALYVLIALVAFTLIIDLLFTRILLRPLNAIIRTKLTGRTFPFTQSLTKVKTSTTDFASLDDALIELMQQVREAFEKEREFTSNASHELMTPISILRNKMENLLVSTEDEQAQEKIGGMMQTLNRLTKIVNSLLLISRIDNDQYNKNDTVDAAVFFKELQQELEDRMEGKEISYSANIAAGLKFAGVNHDLLFQLFYNLINNAIRYNKQGGSIHISASLAANNTCSVQIKDSGIGIAPDIRDNIFDRFKKSGNNEGESFGIGLSIVKSIASYHQLNIQVDSTPGEGSVFTVQFPEEMVATAK